MEVSGISSSYDSLASMASGLQSGQVGLQIATAIMKQALDSQKQQGEALVKMISATSLDGAGRLIDIRA